MYAGIVKAPRKRFRLVRTVTVVLVTFCFIIVATLYAQQKRAFRERTLCVSHLHLLWGAKARAAHELGLKDGAPIPAAALDKEMNGMLATWKCPTTGSEYIYGAVGITPRCTYTNVSYLYKLEDFKIVRWAYFHRIPHESTATNSVAKPTR